MRTYERTTRLPAPLDRVWAFHATTEGLKALTPGWLNLRVESVRGPDGATLPEGADLVAGTRLELSVRPFGVGPRQRWVAAITERERRPGAAYFRDEMRDGPFRSWRHTHCFYADGAATLLRDHVAYETPAGGAADPLAGPALDVFFRYRHRRTREAVS